jgi:hypothetical protein
LFNGEILLRLAVDVVQVDFELEFNVDGVALSVLVFSLNGELVLVETVGVHVETRHPELSDLFLDLLLSGFD